MTAQSVKVRQVISRSKAIIAESLLAELSGAVACCRIANRKNNEAEKLVYLIVAERTSAKFVNLHAQGKLTNSESILESMIRLEEALGGTPTCFLGPLGGQVPFCRQAGEVAFSAPAAGTLIPVSLTWR